MAWVMVALWDWIWVRVDHDAFCPVLISLTVLTNAPLLTGMDTHDGKVHSVETNMYSPHDVAAETEVVDGIGQRLTLSIENIRGGGGQRRIAVYCPFW